MSHSYRYKNTVFTCNSDLSGNVRITVMDNGDGVPTGDRIEISGADIIKFVADHVRRSKISDLEQATTKEILGLSR